MSNTIKRKLTVTEILDAMSAFREWIGETKLYNVLVEQTCHPFGVSVRIESDEITIPELKSGVKIRTPYDLPIEMIYNFYINSPFYKIDVELEENYLPQLQNLIENGNQ